MEDLSLETEKVPRIQLLVLAYMLIEKEMRRVHLGELFWPTVPKEKQIKSLSGILQKLEKLEVVSRKPTLKAYGITDVDMFYQKLQENPIEAAELYKGNFLAGVENDKRYEIGEELQEWIEDKRYRLHDSALSLFLRLAEDHVAQGHFKAAQNYALRAYKLCNMKAPHQGDYERLVYLLLVTGQQIEAKSLAEEFETIFSQKLVSSTNESPLLQASQSNSPDYLRNLQNIELIWLGAVSAANETVLHASVLALERNFDNAGQQSKAIELIDKALHSTFMLDDDLLRSKCFASKAWLLFRQNHHDESMQCAETALKKLGNEAVYFRRTCFNTLGAIHDLSGNFEKASDYFSQALELCKEGIYEYAIVTMNLAISYINQGKYDVAKALLSKAYIVFKNEGRISSQAHYANAMSRLHFEMGDYTAANKVVEEILTKLDAASHAHWDIILKLRQAQVLAVIATDTSLAEAGHIATTALTRATNLNAQGSIAIAHSVLTEIEIRKENTHKAYSHFMDSLKTGKDNQAVFLHHLVQSIPIFINLGKQSIVAQIVHLCNDSETQNKMFAHSKKELSNYSFDFPIKAVQTVTLEQIRSILLSGL